ncbi:MAG: hypothetical protein AAFY41_05065, partial [Bacteroidota bacterium]
RSGSDGENGGNNGEDGFTSLIVASPSTSCEDGGITIQIGLDENDNDILDTEEIASSYNLCNGTDGLNSLIACTVEPEGDNCPNGGILIEIGIDSDQDGTLNTDEKIGQPKYICNGLDGADGLDGRSPIINVDTDVPGCENGGIALTFGYDDDADGTIDEVLETAQICNGANANDGSDGLNTIIETIADPAECTNGGLEIRVGLDKNRDGDIDESVDADDNELVSTEIICNGEDGMDGNDGREIIMTSVFAPCGDAGGRTYSFGYDNDNDGVIDDLLTSFTVCNGEDGTDGNSDGIFEFYFSKGFNGYEETIDVSINEQGRDEYNQILSVDFADANQSNSIIYFPKIQEIVQNGVNSEPFEVVEAVLYVRSAVAADPKTPFANENWVGVKTFTPDAPLVRDGVSTWFAADGSDEVWKSPGAAVTEEGGANAFSDMFRLPTGLVFDGVIPLLLNRKEVTQWLIEESRNKGMILTMAGSNTYEIDFYSSEYIDDPYLRPTLYIKVQTNTKSARVSTQAKDYNKRWSEKSYDEKLIPLKKRD